MTALHLLMDTCPAAWRDCVATLQVGDTVLLVDAGVGLLADPHSIALIRAAGPGALMASAPDVAARGLGRLAREHGVSLVGDAAWVEAVGAHSPVLSWI